jgi:hypothetical protein
MAPLSWFEASAGVARKLMKAPGMTKLSRFASALVLVAASLGHTAHADELASSHPGAHDPAVAITISPLHLFVPMAEVTTELRATSRLGIAVITGIGSFREMDTNQRVTLYEGGASARYYVTGSFRKGIQLGAEALYVHASTSSTTVDVKAAGLALSPFVGAKWTLSSGFTTELQVGASFMAARGSASTGAMANRSDVGPLLNMQVGYTF